MEREIEYCLVAAPNKAGESLIRLLEVKGIPYAALVNNETEEARMRRIGVKRICTVDTNAIDTWQVPDWPIGKVFLFEQSLPLCCRYIQVCRSWTSKPIYVITQSPNPRAIYKGLGADYVIYSRQEEMSFLMR
ncbi:hypothetical protein [Paenibacillus sp. MBLB4367]|uniref:hypothetical protein n=1 Tax=Paenibacillus sp. MBLB4367 TaxID=3384767 RepID=UPI003908383C